MGQPTDLPGDWVAVRTCITIFEAFVLSSVLEASEIECLLPDESLLGARPELALALGGARVLVRREDLERAAEALRVVADGAD